jgi:hypothetical protein
MGDVLRAKSADLVSSVLAISVMLVLSASIMYYAEHDAQPDKFASIPESMWWAVCTLTTVGYGDVFPVTAVGKLAASVISILGIGLFAIPTGIWLPATLKPRGRGVCWQLTPTPAPLRRSVSEVAARTHRAVRGNLHATFRPHEPHSRLSTSRRTMGSTALPLRRSASLSRPTTLSAAPLNGCQYPGVDLGRVRQHGKTRTARFVPVPVRPSRLTQGCER